MFESINFGPLGNPAHEAMTDMLNDLTRSRELEKQRNIERAKMLMQQANIDSDNRRADAQMKLQQDEFTRSGKNQAEAQQRQGAEDFAKIYEASGKNPDLARQLAKAHGYEIVDTPQGPVAVKASPAPMAPQAPVNPAPAMSPPGGEVDAVSGGALPPPPTQPPSVGMNYELAKPPQAPAGAPTPSQGDLPLPMSPEDMPDEPPTAPESVGQKLSTASRFKLRKNGQEVDVDPAAAKAAQDEAFAEQLKLKSAAPEQRILAAQLENEKKRQFQLEHPELRSEPLTFDEREKLANIAANGRVSAARVSMPYKEETANRQAVGQLEKVFQDYQRNSQYGALMKENRAVQKTMANIADGTVPLQHRDAQIQLARIFREAQPTEGEMKLVYDHLGGTADKWNQFVARISTGDLSAEQLHQMKAAAKSVSHEHDRFVHSYATGLGTRLGPTTAYSNMPDEVNALYQSSLQALGIDSPPDLYGETQGGPKLGSRSAGSVKPKGNPIVNAAKTAKLAPEDKAAIDWAKAHSGDPRAAKILKMHGM